MSRRHLHVLEWLHICISPGATYLWVGEGVMEANHGLPRFVMPFRTLVYRIRCPTNDTGGDGGTVSTTQLEIHRASRMNHCIGKVDNAGPRCGGCQSEGKEK